MHHAPRRLVPALALLVAAPAAAQQPAAPLPALDPQQAQALRCGVGFAFVARLQAEGAAEGARYPVLGTRGREYFVRVAARIMDQTGADRAAVAALITRESTAFAAEPGRLAETMPECLPLLEAAGL